MSSSLFVTKISQSDYIKVKKILQRMEEIRFSSRAKRHRKKEKQQVLGTVKNTKKYISLLFTSKDSTPLFGFVSKNFLFLLASTNNKIFPLLSWIFEIFCF